MFIEGPSRKTDGYTVSSKVLWEILTHSAAGLSSVICLGPGPGLATMEETKSGKTQHLSSWREMPYVSTSGIAGMRVGSQREAGELLGCSQEGSGKSWGVSVDSE